MGLLKGIIKTFSDILGLSDLCNSENGQNLQNTANDLTQTICARKFFQTKSEKQAAERRAKEQERNDISNIAKSTGDIFKQINELLKKL